MADTEELAVSAALSALRGAGFVVDDIGTPLSEKLLKAALWYAEQGIPVFPVKPRDKVPLVKWRNPGHDDVDDMRDIGATTDPAIVVRWWERWPEANIGMPTGEPQWDVIDLDGEPGFRSFGELNAEGRIPEILGKVKTPRGRHAYIAPTGAGPATNIRPGVDYRGIGGYVVVPPSVGKSGESYSWIEFPRRVA